MKEMTEKRKRKRVLL